MGKVKRFFSRISGGSLKRMSEQINHIHNETNKKRPVIFADMIWCIFRYGVGYRDYRVFGFWKNHGKKRKTFLTQSRNITLSHRLNSEEFYPIFNDKALFNKRFADLIGRDFIDLRNADRERFKTFCGGKSSVFAKPVNDFGGHGISKEVIDKNTDLDGLYERLISHGQFLVEETITQHEKMSLLSPFSVNTLRIVTVLHNGKANVLYAVVRMSVNENCVDNTCSGGLYAPIDSGGTIRQPAFCDSTGKFYSVHPYTKTEFNGFEIPMFREAVALCERAAARFPQMGYIGWDVAITKSSPVLIEGNTLPNYSLCQNYMYIENNIGILPRLGEILGDDFFKAAS